MKPLHHQKKQQELMPMEMVKPFHCFHPKIKTLSQKVSSKIKKNNPRTENKRKPINIKYLVVAELLGPCSDFEGGGGGGE
jgi:hypothetical protein